MTPQNNLRAADDVSEHSRNQGKLAAPESGLIRMIRTLLVVCAGLLSLLYILNPGAGIIELIPDNIPGIGNLDEAFFTVLLVSCGAYFGYDIRLLIGPLKDVCRRELGKPARQPK